MIAGMCCAPTAPTTPNPSSSGIWMSRKTRSIPSCSSAWTASRPWRASPTTTMSGSYFSSRRMPFRAAGSSSTISTRIRAEQLGEAVPNIGEAEPAPVRVSVAAIEPSSVVAHREQQPAVHPAGRHDDPAAGGSGRDAVPQRILDERLEDEVGHAGVERFVVHCEHYLETVAEADLLDLQVAPQERELLPEGNHLRRDVVEHRPQQVSEARDDADGVP